MYNHLDTIDEASFNSGLDSSHTINLRSSSRLHKQFCVHFFSGIEPDGLTRAYQASVDDCMNRQAWATRASYIQGHWHTPVFWITQTEGNSPSALLGFGLDHMQIAPDHNGSWERIGVDICPNTAMPTLQWCPLHLHLFNMIGVCR